MADKIANNEYLQKVFKGANPNASGENNKLPTCKEILNASKINGTSFLSIPIKYTDKQLVAEKDITINTNATKRVRLDIYLDSSTSSQLHQVNIYACPKNIISPSDNYAVCVYKIPGNSIPPSGLTNIYIDLPVSENNDYIFTMWAGTTRQNHDLWQYHDNVVFPNDADGEWIITDRDRDRMEFNSGLNYNEWLSKVNRIQINIVY